MPDIQELKILGHLIRSKRIELGIKLTDLEHQINIDKGVLFRLENGFFVRNINDICVKIANVLDLSSDSLFDLIFEARRQKITRNATRHAMVRSTAIFNVEFAKAFLEWRLEQGLTHQHVAAKIGTSTEIISRVERTGRLPNRKTATLIATLIDYKGEVRITSRGSKAKVLKKFKASGTRLEQFIFDRRQELGLSSDELAVKANVCRPSVFVRGYKVPQKEILERICKVLGCEIPFDFLPIKVSVVLWDEDADNLRHVRGLSKIDNDKDLIVEALKVLKGILELQRDGYIFCKRKDGEEAKEISILPFDRVSY